MNRSRSRKTSSSAVLVETGSSFAGPDEKVADKVFVVYLHAG
jgi:hypothetical protein